ncbi:LOW QUALITY PROTEIN: Hypothetical protein PHPALM_36212 [Phytophthora palmivora]|uniref:Uncharacterized protein n=1 Tax=Phytophthora palmivora TaxID=4796 RepID=A0A2P4X0I1_9STRA|nr:LOW QUALITY PROTEIN: Hypothetical protein PHPALM_36212 [Phytophthora palmivora]
MRYRQRIRARLLENDIGNRDAAGLIDTTRAWTKLERNPWRDLTTLFAQLQKARNEIDRKTRKQDFTMDQVDDTLH